MSQFLEETTSEDETDQMVLSIPSVLLRQELSRALHSSYGFDQFKVEFRAYHDVAQETCDDDDEFVLTKLKDKCINYLQEEEKAQQAEQDYEMYEA